MSCPIGFKRKRTSLSLMQHVFCEMEAKQGQLRTKPTRTMSVSGPIASVLNKRFLNPSSRSCRGLQK
jgi:hypothetical protein